MNSPMFGLVGGIMLAGLLTVEIGCTAAQQTAVAAGQLFCAKATPEGALVVALLDALGVPVIVTNKAASIVAAACAAIDGIPVVPPASPATAPQVAAPVMVTPLQVTPVPPAGTAK